MKFFSFIYGRSESTRKFLFVVALFHFPFILSLIFYIHTYTSIITSHFPRLYIILHYTYYYTCSERYTVRSLRRVRYFTAVSRPSPSSAGLLILFSNVARYHSRGSFCAQKSRTARGECRCYVWPPHATATALKSMSTNCYTSVYVREHAFIKSSGAYRICRRPVESSSDK